MSARSEPRATLGSPRKSDFDADRDLRRSIGMMKAADRLLGQAIGGLLLELAWQPGQPVDHRIREYQQAAEQLRSALQTVEAAVVAHGGY